jgi:hypothetical protein
MRDSAMPQPPASLHQYLTRHHFAPHPENSAWLDRDTGQQIIRVHHDPGEATLLYCLTPNTVCPYEAVFSPGTPDAIIIAAVQTALQHIPPQTGPGIVQTGHRKR